MQAARKTPARALLLDLGDTLERAGVVLPGVVEALDRLGEIESSPGERLRLGLVSNYIDRLPGDGEGEVERLFREYVEIVRGLGLLRFFTPPEHHVTLSTQAGVRKPHRRIFELAMQRLGLATRLEECVFITEDAEHVAADWRSATPVLLDALGVDVDRARVAMARFREVLEDNHAIAPPGAPLPPGATHTVETDERGDQILVRRRFSIS
jgi:hypothetical protein